MIENGLKTIEALMAGNQLFVPLYQRSYAWTDANVRVFVDDLLSHPEQRPYFLGSVLLTVKDQNDTKYNIVDGQQRLTTAVMLVIAARKLLPGENDRVEDAFETLVSKRNSRKFHTTDDDEPFFNNHIVRGNPCFHFETPSQRRLAEAADVLESLLRALSRQQTVAIVDRLLRSQVLVFGVESELYATQVFELQNDRGKSLTNLELLKSFLMHCIFRYGGKDQDAGQKLDIVQRDFAAIFRTCETIESMPSAPDEDAILRYHLIASENWLGGEPAGHRPKDWARIVLDGKCSRQARIDFIVEFASRLRQTYRAVLSILEDRDKRKSRRDGHDDLGGIFIIGRVGVLWPIMIRAWQCDATQEKSEWGGIVEVLEQFSFLTALTGKRADAGQRQLAEMARAFLGDYPALEKDLHWVSSWWDMPRLVRISLDSVDFYSRGPLATYVLWRYENFLRDKPARKVSLLRWRDVLEPTGDARRLEKDHIEPKNPANPNLALPVWWDAASTFEKACLNRLGNLVLDTKSPNASRGDRQFADRIASYATNGYASQEEIVSRFAQNGKIWDGEAVKRRHTALIEFVENELVPQQVSTPVN